MIDNFSKFSESLNNFNTKLISAFPGTGKSYFYNNSDLNVLDSDSSTFDKSNFPQNYIKHIKDNIGKVDVILISSHKDVRDALVENNIKFTLVYPEKSLKDEYLKRYKERGNDDKFIQLLESNWENWMNELNNQKGCNHIILQSGEYISDKI